MSRMCIEGIVLISVAARQEVKRIRIRIVFIAM